VIEIKLLNKIKVEVKKKLADKLVKADILTIASFLIIFGTTFSLNKYVAMYILSAFLLITSYFVSK
jgi:hypothetical protein